MGDRVQLTTLHSNIMGWIYAGELWGPHNPTHYLDLPPPRKERRLPCFPTQIGCLITLQARTLRKGERWRMWFGHEHTRQYAYWLRRGRKALGVLGIWGRTLRRWVGDSMPGSRRSAL